MYTFVLKSTPLLPFISLWMTQIKTLEAGFAIAVRRIRICNVLDKRKYYLFIIFLLWRPCTDDPCFWISSYSWMRLVSDREGQEFCYWCCQRNKSCLLYLSKSSCFSIIRMCSRRLRFHSVVQNLPWNEALQKTGQIPLHYTSVNLPSVSICCFSLVISDMWWFAWEAECSQSFYVFRQLLGPQYLTVLMNLFLHCHCEKRNWCYHFFL